MGLGLSMFRWCREIPPSSEGSNDEEKAEVNTNLFSCIVHELVVCTAEYLPITRKGWVRDDEVVRRIAISISYLCVMDADPVSGRRLNVCVLPIHPKTVV